VNDARRDSPDYNPLQPHGRNVRSHDAARASWISIRAFVRPKIIQAMIKQRTLGRTGLNVSELCLGTMNFGWKTDEQKSFDLLDAFREAGGNFIQAAGHCPAPLLTAASTTFSEEVVGRWSQSRDIPRGERVLATRLSLGRIPEGVAMVKFTRDCVRDSLHRLRTDYVDLLVIEWSDSLLPVPEFLKVFDALVREGLVRYIGAANFPNWRVAEAIARAPLSNHCRMEALQSDYSLLTRARFEPEAMALCEEQRLGFLARSPLSGGFLARGQGRHNRFNASRRDWLEQRFGNAYGDAALAAVSDVAARHEASPAQVALSWVLHNPAVTSAVIGVHSVAQLDELVQVTSLPLETVDLEQLDHATATEEVRVTPRNADNSLAMSATALGLEPLLAEH
jgi:aryl-alcohol dehydrogenase-like predicted oxidoreductase